MLGELYHVYADPVWFGYQFGNGYKRSVNEAEPIRWDLLDKPGQHGSVRLFGECKHFYNRANFFQSDKRVTSGMRSSQLLAEEYYECRMNDFFSKGTIDSAWTDREVHCLIDFWADKEIQTLLESAKRNNLF